VFLNEDYDKGDLTGIEPLDSFELYLTNELCKRVISNELRINKEHKQQLKKVIKLHG
jgi:hypothetical protein